MENLICPSLHCESVQAQLVMEWFKSFGFRDTYSKLLAGGLDHSEFAVKGLSMLYGYWVCDRQVYVVGPTMQNMLSATSLDGIWWSDVKLPFDTFYIALPGCNELIWGGDQTKWHKLRGVYVQHSHRPDRPGTAQYRLNHPPGTHTWSVQAWGATHRGAPEDDDAMYQYHVVARPGESPAESITHLVTGKPSEPPRWDADVHGGSVVQQELASYIYQLIINLCLYLASQNADLISGVADSRQRTLLTQKLSKARSSRQRRKLSSKLNSLSKARVTWVGPSVAKRPKESGYGGAPVRGRYWTAGHYMRYWVGSKTAPDGSPRKGSHTIIRWREPFCTNADLAATVERRVRKCREPEKGSTVERSEIPVEGPRQTEGGP